MIELTLEKEGNRLVGRTLQYYMKLSKREKGNTANNQVILGSMRVKVRKTKLNVMNFKGFKRNIPVEI